MEVLDAAKAVAADPAATQETVDAAQNALDAAMNIAPIQKEFELWQQQERAEASLHAVL